MTTETAPTFMDEVQEVARQLHLDQHDVEVFLMPAMRRVKQIGFNEGKAYGKQPF